MRLHPRRLASGLLIEELYAVCRVSMKLFMYFQPQYSPPSWKLGLRVLNAIGSSGPFKAS